MQGSDRPQGAALAILLTVEDAIHRGLGCTEFLGNLGLAPLGGVFDLTEENRNCLVHPHRIYANG